MCSTSELLEGTIWPDHLLNSIIDEKKFLNEHE
jgi:hypothetical protein